MTAFEIELATQLSRCTFFPASYDKYFARDMLRIAANSPDTELTKRQTAYLRKLAHKYRVQMSRHGYDAVDALINEQQNG